MSFDKDDILGICRVIESPSQPHCLLKTTLQMILDVSVHSATSISLLSAEKFVVLKQLLSRFTNKPDSIHNEIILSILVNVTADNESLSTQVLESESFIASCSEIAAAQHNEIDSKIQLRCAQLLANLSRHSPQAVCSLFEKYWSSHILNVLNMLSTNAQIKAFDYYGYVLMNLSTISSVRNEIARQHLPSLLSLISSKVNSKRRFCAVNITYNLSFDEHLHSWLLKEVSETVLDEHAFLTAVVKPLADSNDELSDTEMEKLPLQLQYYEGRRETDIIIALKLVEILYQLCATKIGRETLRQLGIYALMREVDKSRQSTTSLAPNIMIMEDDIIPAKHPPSETKERKNLKDDGTLALNEQFDATLHALIGVLIRYESEMCISDEAFSLRELVDKAEVEHTKS